MECSNDTNVNSKCDFVCEKGFYNVGSKGQSCKMGYDSPGLGIYYGIEAKWVPQLPPRCEGGLKWQLKIQLNAIPVLTCLTQLALP